MALGKRRREQQGAFWIATEKLCNAPRNVFYDRLNQLLDEIGFDEKLKKAAKHLLRGNWTQGPRARHLLPNDLHWLL